MRFRSSFVLALLLATLSIAGCGGDNLSLCGDNCPTRTPTPSLTTTPSATAPTPNATTTP